MFLLMVPMYLVFSLRVLSDLFDNCIPKVVTEDEITEIKHNIPIRINVSEIC
jgi:hypothetical protein